MDFFKRRPQQQRARLHSIRASAERVTLDTAGAASRQRLKTEAWQRDAWNHRDAIGEVRFAMSFLRYAMSRLTLYPAWADPDGDKPVPADEADGVPAGAVEVARDSLARLTGGTFNYADLLGPFAENLEVPGQCYLVAYDDGGEETVEVRSTEELRVSDRGWELVDSDDVRAHGRPLNPDTSYVARMWQPHPRFRARPDSPMRALWEPCEELLLVSRVVRATTRSRIASAGLLLMPDGMTYQASGDGDGEDDFLGELQDSMAATLRDEGSAESVVPMLVTGPADALKEMRLLTLDRPVDGQLLDRMDKALQRIAMGLDVPPEIVLGMADVNHWTAWQVDDSTFRYHLEPLAQRMALALTKAWLRPTLEAAGFDGETARRLVYWYDPGELIARPNRADDAKAAYAAGALSRERFLESLGFDPEADAATDEELARRAGVLQPADRAAADDPPGLLDDPEDGTPGPTTAVTAAAAPREHERDSRRLLDVDRQLRARLHAAAEEQMRRALERAGNRARSKAQGNPEAAAVVAAAAPIDVTQQLGEAITNALGLDEAVLLDRAFEQLAELWDRMTADARLAAVHAAMSIAGKPVPLAAAQQLVADWKEQHDEARDRWLAELQELAGRLLWGRDRDSSGEGDPDELVPVGTVRAALARAGGLPPQHSGMTADGVPGQPGERVPGVATGHTLERFLAGAGRRIVGYEWVYGISRTPFEPHRRLDGVRFPDFGAPELAHSGWPASTLAPGDHKGCHCDAMPVYADGVSAADEVRALGDASWDDSHARLVDSISRDDIAAGRIDTSTVAESVERERVADSRPSQPTPRPITDSLGG